MKSLKYVIVSLVLALGFAAPAVNAQDQAPKGREGQGRGGEWAAQALKGIDLTADQQAKIKAINADAQKQRQALSQEERGTKGREIMMESSKKVREVLTPEQQGKYDENVKAMRQHGGGKDGKGAKGKDKGGKPAPAPKESAE